MTGNCCDDTLVTAPKCEAVRSMAYGEGGGGTDTTKPYRGSLWKRRICVMVSPGVSGWEGCKMHRCANVHHVFFFSVHRAFLSILRRRCSTLFEESHHALQQTHFARAGTVDFHERVDARQGEVKITFL